MNDAAARCQMIPLSSANRPWRIGQTNTFFWPEPPQVVYFYPFGLTLSLSWRRCAGKVPT
jgi:hypothetical protein